MSGNRGITGAGRACSTVHTAHIAIRHSIQRKKTCLAEVLEVSPLALSVPDIDSEQGLMHTLFALEDLYGFKVEPMENSAALKLENSKMASTSVLQMMIAWAEQAEKYRSGEITKDQYDEWRYNFPKNDTTGHWAKVPSQEFSDAMVDRLKNKLKDM